MATESLTPHRAKRQRSPGYPALALRVALERARVLYAQEARNSAPVTAILEHWGYREGSGKGMVALAALKHFGLLEDEGSGKARRARLARLALSILLDEREESPEREEAIRTAALHPAIHRELWERYEGSIPSDATLKHYLLFDRAFTERAVREFIPQFRATMEFARLDSGATVFQHGQAAEKAAPDILREEARVTSAPAAPAPSDSLGSRRESTYTVPLPGDARVTIQGTFPLTTEEWELVSAQVDLMKRALVSQEDRAEGE